MAATPSVKLVKTFAYRGGTKEWSNRYHFTGANPTDNTHWLTLMNNVIAAEMLCFRSNVSMVEAVGYNAGSDLPVYTHSDSTAGSATLTNYRDNPGAVAALVRYATAARSIKNHPIYLFNYYHGVYGETTTNDDELNHSQRTLFQTYAAAWESGFSDGTLTRVRAGPNGASATGTFVSSWLTHRDFPS